MRESCQSCWTEFVHPAVVSAEVEKGGVCCFISVARSETEGGPVTVVGLTKPLKR